MSEPTEAEAGSKHTTLVFIAVTASTAAVAYNSMAVTTAIPVMKAEFGMSLTTAQWIMNGYTLAAAVLVAAMGRFGDMFGHMRMIVLGMSCFLLGSLSAVLAVDTVIVIGARVLQGVGAAGILSASLAVLNDAVPEAKRAAAVALWGAVLALGVGLGSAIGGALTAINWRAVFAVDMLLVVPALVLALRVIMSSRHRMLGPPAPIDFAGLILLALFIGPLTFALTHGQETGWTAIETILPLAVGIACGVLLIIVESRVKAPLLRIDFFRRRHYVAGSLGMCIAGMNMAMFVYYYVLFAQSPDGLSYTAIVAGLSLLPFSMAMFLLAVGVPRMPAVAGSTWPIAVGMAVMAIGYWFAHHFSSASTIGDTWWPMVLVGTGLGLAYALLPGTALRGLAEKDAGQGSGVINTCLFLGLTLGIVTGGIVSAVSLQTSLSAVVAQLGLAPAEKEQLVHILVHGSPGQIEAAFERAAASGPTALKQATQAAIEASFDDVMLLGAAIALVGLVLMAWLLRGPPNAEQAASANGR